VALREKLPIHPLPWATRPHRTGETDARVLAVNVDLGMELGSYRFDVFRATDKLRE